MCVARRYREHPILHGVQAPPSWEPSGSWEPFGFARQLTEQAAEATPGLLPREPARRLIVITCMDVRLEPLAMLGLKLGDAHVIRNAGAVVSDDVLRSVRLSHSTMRTDRLVVVRHTDCAAHPSDDATEAAVRAAMATIQTAVPALAVNGAIYDLRTGVLRSLA